MAATEPFRSLVQTLTERPRTSRPYFRAVATALIYPLMTVRDPISRLTEREKECLRQWLNHKSAKEIGADLGISHHAVEKRLKMARTKLGATSSLQAARMLGEAEGYGQAVPQSSDLLSNALGGHSHTHRLTLMGVGIVAFISAVFAAFLLQPSTVAGPVNDQPRATATAPVPPARTEAALRALVTGVVRSSPDYSKLNPQFAEVVRRDLPSIQPMFSSLGDLKSVTYLGRGEGGDDLYNMVFAKGAVLMSAALDPDGRMLGGMLRPHKPASIVAPTAGTEAALRNLVAGLANGSPDYNQLSPQFAERVRSDLRMTRSLFSSMGKLNSIEFLGRGEQGDDFYNLVFANGGVVMSAALNADGKMSGGVLHPVVRPAA